jgi:hypothetical protein
VDAHCNACGGRVMRYTQYVAHFRPWAVCGSCGSRVRLRHYREVILATVFSVVVLVVVVVRTRSVPLAIAGLALGTLLAFLADFWTFRNLSWDLEDEPPSSAKPSA